MELNDKSIESEIKSLVRTTSRLRARTKARFVILNYLCPRAILQIEPYKSTQRDGARRQETVAFSSYEQCIQSVSEPFKQVVTTDKLCILGMIAVSAVQLSPKLDANIRIEIVDRNVDMHSDGRGLYTRRNNESVYRLRGVFSSMFLDSINSKQVLTITDTTKHLSWLNSVIDEINQRRKIEDVIDVRFPTKKFG